MLSFKTLLTLALVAVAVQAAAVPSKFLSVDETHLSEGAKENFFMELQGSGGAEVPAADLPGGSGTPFLTYLTSHDATPSTSVVDYIIRPAQTVGYTGKLTVYWYVKVPGKLNPSHDNVVNPLSYDTSAVVSYGSCSHVDNNVLTGSCPITGLETCGNCLVYLSLAEDKYDGAGDHFFTSGDYDPVQDQPAAMIVGTPPNAPVFVEGSAVETISSLYRTFDFGMSADREVLLVYRMITCCYSDPQTNTLFGVCADLALNEVCSTPYDLITAKSYNTTLGMGDFFTKVYSSAVIQAGINNVVQAEIKNVFLYKNKGPTAMYYAAVDLASGLMSEVQLARIANRADDITPPVTVASIARVVDDIIVTFQADDTSILYGLAVVNGTATPTPADIMASGEVIGSQTKTEFIVDGLVGGVTYDYCVFASSDTGNSNVVCNSFVFPDFVAPTYTATVTALESSVLVSGVSDEPTTLTIFVAETAEVVDLELEFFIATEVATAADGSFTFSQDGLTHSTAYTVYVQGFDAAGNVGDVITVNVTTPVPPPNTQKYETCEDATVSDTLPHGSDTSLTAVFGGARVLIKSEIPIEVNADSMTLTLIASASEVGSTFSLFKVTQPWSETGVTSVCAASTGVDRCTVSSVWDIMSSANIASVATATDVSIVDGQLVFDIKDDAAAFTSDNFGWVIVATAGSATFFSSEAAVDKPFLSISYPFDATLGTTFGPTCDTETMNLACGLGTVISVNTASFGRSNSATCPSALSSENQVCTTGTDVTYVVATECNGKSVCSMVADSSTMYSASADPCVATNKYLEGSYSCVASLASMCSTNPCQNGASCANTATGFVCACATGFEGDVCESAIPAGPVGLVAHYPFNDETAKDVVGAHHGVAKNVAYTQGVGKGRGAVVGVYSADSVIDVADDAAFQFTDEFSVSFWVKPTKTASLDVSAEGTDFGVTCEGKKLALSCPAGSSIKVTSASYGRSDGTTCPHPSIRTTTCHSSKSVSFVADRCDGKTSCTVPVTNSGFGDPCRGTYKYLTGKYLCQQDSRTEVLVSQGVFGSGSTQGRAGFGVYSIEDKNGGSAISVRLEREHGRQTLSTAGVSDDEWHFVAVTFNAGTQTLYVDGQAVSETRKGKHGGVKPSSGGLFFGADVSDTSKTQANAVLDEIKIFDYSLSTEEVSEIRSEFVAVSKTRDLFKPEDKVPETVDINLKVFSPSAVGCADGSREGFKDVPGFPLIAACAGGWSVPGVATPLSFKRGCNSQSGNDGEIEGCTVADTCALGWHVCKSASEVRYKTGGKSGNNDAGCDAVSDFETGFFVTRQSGSGYAICGDEGTNDVFGCGKLGSHIQTNCQGLNSFTHNKCSKLQKTGFECSSEGGEAEALSITHNTNTNGGVMCCKDDRYTNSVPKKAATSLRIEVAVVNKVAVPATAVTPAVPAEEEIDEEECAMIGRHIARGCKSKKKKSKKKRGSHSSTKSIKFSCLRVRKSTKSNKSKKSAGSGKSNKLDHGRRRLLQATEPVTYSYLLFDIEPSIDMDADIAATYINEIVNVEGLSDLPTVAGLNKVQASEVLKDCDDGSTQYTCAFVPDVVTLPLPAGLSTANDGYPVEESFVLSNDSPVVIALIVTLVVVVALVLLGTAYRFKYSKNNLEHSFDASIMNTAKPRSDEVELSAVSPAASGASEQDTYWVFNRAQNQNQDVRVVV